MMRSLYSGISGLRNHQVRMDVIANNIANVNTDGYKTSRTVFQDIYSQMLKSGSAGTEAAGTIGALGGTNMAQIGLGMRLATIDVSYVRAAPKITDGELDLMINGDGFFIVNTNGLVEHDPSIPVEQQPILGTEYYTRTGNFTLDTLGRLVTSDGNFVMGYLNSSLAPDPLGNMVINAGADPIFKVDENDANYDPADPTTWVASTDPFEKTDLSVINLNDYTGIGIDSQGIIWGLNASDQRVAIARVGVATFPNNGGLEKVGGSKYIATGSTGATKYSAAAEEGTGDMLQGALEMSNVDLASEFTDMIVTQRGFQANSRIITTSDTMLEELVNLKR